MSETQRRLTWLLALAIAVSAFHYADNYLNYDDFPEFENGPNPGATVVGLSWFAFTAFGIAGWVALRRGRERLAGGLLAVYSGSGLVGLLHYAVPGGFDMPWWRHAHVVADIVLGIAVLVVAVRLARRAPPSLSSSAS